MRSRRSRPVPDERRPCSLAPPIIALGVVALAVAGLLYAPPPRRIASETQQAGTDSGPIKRLRTLGGGVRFEANVGQTDPRVRFLARGPGYTLFLTATEAVLSMPGSRRPTDTASPTLPQRPQPSTLPAGVWRQRMIGANSRPEVEGIDPLLGKSNYFIGNDPTRWRTNVTQYGRVRYRDVYPGIDLVYYGRAGQLEYDFVVAPGAEPRQIRIAFSSGSQASREVTARVEDSGDLLLTNASGELHLRRPEIYQEVDGRRQTIAGRYVVQCEALGSAVERNAAARAGTEAELTFAVAAFDAGRPLIIDPVLLYSTHLGGSREEFGTGIAVDAEGHSYVTGSTSSADFPTENPVQPTLEDRGQGVFGDVFVAKLGLEGDALVYSTYLGGVLSDNGEGIAVDEQGCAYVTGRASLGFPVTAGAFQIEPAGGQDAFVAKLDPTGSSLVYSTFLGGTASDYGDGVTVDGDGNAYVTGGTGSGDFPTANAFEPTFSGGGGHPFLASDAFLAKLNPTGSELIYSTYLGGPAGISLGAAVAVDGEGNAYVTGTTAAADFPTTLDALQPEAGGASDAFISKLSPAGDALVYSTFLGGSGDDAGAAIAVDAEGRAHVAGTTSSLDFPTANAFQNYNAGARDAFVTKLDVAGSELIFATYLGGSETIGSQIRGLDSGEGASGIALDGDGNVYASGTTNSSDFPVRDPFDARNDGIFDAFIAELDPAGFLLFSTFLGSSSPDGANGIAADSEANVYVTGLTTLGLRGDFPTVNPLQPLAGGGAFVTKLTTRSTAQLCAYVMIVPTPRGGVAPNTSTVAVIEAARKEVMGELRLGTRSDLLQDIAISADGRAAYIVNAGPVFFPAAAAARGPGSFLAVVDTHIHAPTASISFAELGDTIGLHQVALSPDGSTAYLETSLLGLFVIDTATNAQIARIPDVGAFDLVMAPDGRRLYAIGVAPGVRVIDTAANAVVAAINFPYASVPTGAAITPDGASLYVAAHDFQAVGVVDTATNTLATFIPVPAWPNRIAISPDGRTAYLAHDRPRQFGTLSIIDTQAKSVIATVALESPTNELAVTPDGKFIYLTNGDAGTVTVLETRTYQIVTVIPVGGKAGSIAVATMPNGCMPVPACTGDCDYSRVVGIDEVLLAANVALGGAFASACRAADADGDNSVSIDELVAAVGATLDGCPSRPHG